MDGKSSVFLADGYGCFLLYNLKSVIYFCGKHGAVAMPAKRDSFPALKKNRTFVFPLHGCLVLIHGQRKKRN